MLRDGWLTSVLAARHPSQLLPPRHDARLAHPRPPHFFLGFSNLLAGDGCEDVEGKGEDEEDRIESVRGAHA